MPEVTWDVTANYEGAAGHYLNDLSVPEAPTNDIDRALIQFRIHLPSYLKYGAYYRGDQRLTFASLKFRNTFGNLFYNLADNLSSLIVDSIADRLIVTSYGVEDGAEILGEDAWEIWQRNRMDANAGMVHREALRAGDAYVLVWPDKAGKAVLWPQAAVNITVYWDEDNPSRLEWAAKLWLDGAHRIRLNMYYADRVEKYVTRLQAQGVPEKGRSFEMFETPGEPWPLPNPWGEVPIVPFNNNAWIASFGTSEIAAILPLQDALNKTLCDQLVAQEYAAFPQRYATGIQIDYDENGKPVAPFNPGVDRVWMVGAPDAKFGQFEQARMTEFLAIEESLRGEIARIAGIPPHYVVNLSGGYPSGEALRTAEARFISKIKQRQTNYGNAWENVMRIALMQEGSWRDSRLTVNWVDASPISETEHLDQLLKKQGLGVTQDQLLLEAGYGETDIEAMNEERANTRTSAVASFNAGTIENAAAIDSDFNAAGEPSEN
jgi:hypothetical protein